MCLVSDGVVAGCLGSSSWVIVFRGIDLGVMHFECVYSTKELNELRWLDECCLEFLLILEEAGVMFTDSPCLCGEFGAYPGVIEAACSECNE